VFCKPAALRALSALQTLSVSLIPMASLAALASLAQLDSLVLRQAQPVSSAQCLALAACRHLADLTLSSVQWADMSHLAPLTQLTRLSVQVGWCVNEGLGGGAALALYSAAVDLWAGLEELTCQHETAGMLQNRQHRGWCL
jgi:hypothetical protein